MLPSQRALFDMPRDVCFLNAAAWSPLPLASQEAGRAAMARKGQPWKLDGDFQAAQYERARKAAAALIGADPDDVALISSVGYGVSTAGKVLSIPRGSRVIVLRERSHLAGAGMDEPRRGRRLHASRRSSSRPTATGPRRCWTRSSARARRRWRWRRSPRCTGRTAARSTWRASPRRAEEQGAALLVDATHDAGVRRIDVKTLDPDFLIFPTYKWVLGPYGRAFLYVAKRQQNGVPLEQTARGAQGGRPRTRSISATRPIATMRGATTWASATISSRWRWRRSAWR